MLLRTLNFPGAAGYNLCERVLRFADWFLCAVGCPHGEGLVPTDSREAEWYYRNFQVDLFYKYPADYMACLSTAIAGGSSNRLGHFPTPQSVVEGMVQMLMHDTKDDRKTMSVCDPCTGTGIMLLNASNYSLNLYGIELSHNITKLALVNMYLYVPWVVWGAEFHDDGTLTPSGKLIQGNALTAL